MERDHEPESGTMKRLALLLILLLIACDYSLIGPADPMFEEECTVYISEGETVDVPREKWERCVSIQMYVVRFNATCPATPTEVVAKPEW